MKNRNRNRKRDIKLYNHLYRVAIKCDLEKCIYCSDHRACLDHIPPISTVENIDISEYKESGGRFLLVPVCKKCNSLLGNYSSNSIYERIDYLILKYTKKMKLRPIWTEDELSEMSERFIQYHKAVDYKWIVIENKLIHLNKQLASKEFEDFY